MAVTHPTMFNGMYCGSLTGQQIALILQTRELDKIENLKNIIYDFPQELVDYSIETQTSIREFCKDIELHKGELKDEQTVGVGFMYLSPRSILGDGVGYGKTAEVAGLINLLKQRKEITRFLIAVESSAGADIQTQRELVRFTGLNIIILPSEKPKMEKVIESTDWNKIDGVVIKHSALRSDTLSMWLARNLDDNGMSSLFDTFFLDESSVVKKKGNKVTEYTRNICNIMKSRVHFMNATTFETHLMEVYTQLDIMCPDLLPRQYRIEKEFCSYTLKKFWIKVQGKPTQKTVYEPSGYKNQAVFKESCKLVYFGRALDTSDGKITAYNQIKHSYKVIEVMPTTEQLLEIGKGHRYMEVLNSPENIEDCKVKMNTEEVPKLKELIDLIKTDYKNKKIMVYVFHIKAQQKIQEELTKIGMQSEILNGETKQADRAEIVNRFNKGSTDVLITNIKKSLNLNNGEVCIMYSVEPTPAKMEQIRGRIDRHTDTKVKEFVLLVYKHTDEYRLLMEKVKQRSKDAKDLTIDSKTAIDYFIESMND